MVQAHRDNHRVALDYDANADPVNLVTDACLTGGAGTLSQGRDWKTAPMIAFWSGKFNPAQRNYPVYGRELLTIIESLKRFWYLLLGIRFCIFTNHKPLEFLLQQKNPSARQQRWIDILNDFDFEIKSRARWILYQMLYHGFMTTIPLAYYNFHSNVFMKTTHPPFHLKC
jgi:hypothetical protein